jgi:hypothetical protein
MSAVNHLNNFGQNPIKRYDFALGQHNLVKSEVMDPPTGSASNGLPSEFNLSDLTQFPNGLNQLCNGPILALIARLIEH